MRKRGSVGLVTSAVRTIGRVTFFSAYGFWRIVAGTFAGTGRTASAVRLLGESLPCPSCQSPNALHGRWRCQACSAVYHGFVARCSVCGAGARFFPCEHCGVSVPLGGRR